MASSSSTLSRSCTRAPPLLADFRSRRPATEMLSFKWRGSGVPPRMVSVAARRYKGTLMREEMLAEMIERKVAEATEACSGDGEESSDGCRVAWDEVEEVSKAKAHLRRRLEDPTAADPLEPFCAAHPDAEDCAAV